MQASGHGHDLGHASHGGFDWGDYVAWITAREGTLAAAAERLSAARAWTDDRASIERALRRLRDRGDRDGGLWGARCLAVFGLPDALERRARWLGTYHSRFTDMPVALCEDLLRLWDRPPVNASPSALPWIALAHASCALRAARPDDAHAHLRRARGRGRGCRMLARVAGDGAEADDARARSMAIVAQLDDEALRLRFTHGR